MANQLTAPPATAEDTPDGWCDCWRCTADARDAGTLDEWGNPLPPPRPAAVERADAKWWFTITNAYERAGRG